jgi:hypothetical protein
MQSVPHVQALAKAYGMEYEENETGGWSQVVLPHELARFHEAFEAGQYSQFIERDLIPIEDLAIDLGVDDQMLYELADKKIIPSIEGRGGDRLCIRKSATLNLEHAIRLNARHAA